MFYYKDGYEMEVAKAAENLIIARDKYIEAVFAWNDKCVSGYTFISDECEVIKTALEHVEEERLKEYAEEKKNDNDL